MSEASILAKQLSIRPKQAAAAIQLLDQDNTVPFIARYRKEVTEGLDDEQLQNLNLGLRKLRAVTDRREAIRKALTEQEKLTDKLDLALKNANSLTELEDIYAPYKQKRKTRGMVAKEKGLGGLALKILKQEVSDKTAEETAEEYVKFFIPSAKVALEGARDIVAEVIADNPSVRQALRKRALGYGKLTSEKKDKADDPKNLFDLYYDYQIPVHLLRPHQTLAINRGETEGVLRVKADVAEHDKTVSTRLISRPNPASPFHDQLVMATEDAVKRLLMPAIERDVRRILTEKAEGHAIAVFGKNLSDLLSQAPLVGHTVLAVDPGYRTGCKIAVMDETGKVLNVGTIYPHKPRAEWDDALKRLAMLVNQHNVSVVSIGNGTASRETEKLIAELVKTFTELKYLITNEAGASVYSASEVARAELPDMDVSMRGAVSIGRRVQDPLAELVKIDPKSIGVGLYQHDVNQKQLAESLDGVVEIVVNRVGVDVNTASPALLSRVAGIGPKLAERIVEFRDENGAFANRSRLQKVSGLGKKSYEQCAGFLRVRDGDNALDQTAIHPESYDIAKKVMERAGITLEMDEGAKEEALAQLPKLAVLAKELDVGEPTLADIYEQIVKPGRDPRDDVSKPLLRSDVLSMDDLKVGQVLHGTVRNVVDFGAFIDIGVKRDGLLHRTVTPKGTELSVGQVLPVEIEKVDKKRDRISLKWVDNG